MGNLLLALILLGLYFLPTFIAVSRHHHQVNSIAVINFFFGWTFIGWVVALAMAASHIPADVAAQVELDRQVHQAVKAKCSECGADASPSAKFCPSCGVQFEAEARPA